jgi:hypothetical protein
MIISQIRCRSRRTTNLSGCRKYYKLMAQLLRGRMVLVSLDRSVSAFGGFGSDVGMTLEEKSTFTATEATKSSVQAAGIDVWRDLQS